MRAQAQSCFYQLWRRVEDIRHAWAEFPQNAYRIFIYFKTCEYQSYLNTWCITNGNYVSNNAESWRATVAVPDSAGSCRIWAWPILGLLHRDATLTSVVIVCSLHRFHRHFDWCQWCGMFDTSLCRKIVGLYKLRRKGKIAAHDSLNFFFRSIYFNVIKYLLFFNKFCQIIIDNLI